MDPAFFVFKKKQQQKKQNRRMACHVSVCDLPKVPHAPSSKGLTFGPPQRLYHKAKTIVHLLFMFAFAFVKITLPVPSE